MFLFIYNMYILWGVIVSLQARALRRRTRWNFEKRRRSFLAAPFPR